MNKRGNLLESNLVFLIVATLFIVGMFLFVSNYKNGAALQEDFYAKEIAYLINAAEPGTEVKLDVTDAMRLAEKNDVADLTQIIQIDNENQEVIVSLTPGAGKAFPYFNNVVIYNQRIEYLSEDLETNYLEFEVR